MLEATLQITTLQGAGWYSVEMYLIELGEWHIPSIIIVRSHPVGIHGSGRGVEKIEETSRSHRTQKSLEPPKHVVWGRSLSTEKKHQFEGPDRIQLAQHLEKHEVCG